MEPLPPSPCLSLPRTQRDARRELAGWQVLQVESVQLQLQMVVGFFIFLLFILFYFFLFPTPSQKAISFQEARSPN